jgi:tRNA A-37 threonylcarbamoyl transferase component Bud32
VKGEVVADRYELEALLGHGGMSNVYRARDRLLERRVALKVLHERYAADEQFLERFRREARAVAQLSHPNIVTVIDRGEDEAGRQFIVFEYLEGPTLKDLLEETGPLPVQRALELGIEIAHGLSFAHEHGLVHRDVKPQNVLLNGDGQAKVTDFGIARSLDVEQSMTQSGTVLGTSNYIAPEQASGREVDAHTDVYSLGVVLFELLTGEVPFRGETFVAVALQHVHEPPPSVLERRPDVPPRVAAAIERALEKDPDDRFGSMEEFAAELEACLMGLDADDGETTLVPRRPPVPPVVRRRALWRRRWLPVALAGLAVLLLAAALAGVVLTRGGEPTSLLPLGGSGSAKPVRLAGVGSWDPPPGDGAEHDEDVDKATDRDPATYWTTEHYRSFDKPGVGLVLEAPDSVALDRLTIVSDTPGFTAEIRSGPSPSGPFETVSRSEAVGDRTAFAISAEPSRYYVVWITNPGPGGFAHVNEVTAR